MAARTASIKRAVDSAVRSAQLTPREEATAALAKRLATEIDGTDDPDMVAKLSARLLPTLEALGMTRKPAAGSTNGGDSGDSGTVLDQLRARRARLGNAAPVDSAPAGSRRARG